MPDYAVRTAFTATDRVSPAFRRMGSEVDRFGRRGTAAFSRVGRAASAVGGAMRGLLPMLGAAAVVEFGRNAMEAFRVEEAAIANVNAGLASTNNAIGMTTRQFQDLAADLQRNGIFGDETILQNATAQLLTFGNITSANFARVQTAATDVTTKLYGVNASGEQLRAVSLMMGKAMEDPIRGLTAMRRVGISFNATEERMIRGLIASGDALGAQNAMLAAIERQYGGTNAALAQTNAGMDRMAQNSMGDTMELIGQQMMPLKRTIMDFAVWLLPKINEALPVMVEFLKAVAPVAIAAAIGFGLYKVALMGVAFWQGVLLAAGWLKYLWMMRSFITSVTIKQWLWNAAMSMNPIGLVIIAVAALITIGILLYRNWDVVKEKFIAAGQAMWGVMRSIGSGIMTVMMAPINLLISGIIQLLELASNIPGVGGRFAAAAQSAREFQANANATVGSRNLLAPNASEVQGRQPNLVVNVNNAQPGTSATVRPRNGAAVNMARAGANP